MIYECFSDEIAIDFPSVGRSSIACATRSSASREAKATSHDRRVVVDARRRGRPHRSARSSHSRHCPDCGGRGESWTEPCDGCCGTGEPCSSTRSAFTLPPGVADGSRFRFRVTRRTRRRCASPCASRSDRRATLNRPAPGQPCPPQCAPTSTSWASSSSSGALLTTLVGLSTLALGVGRGFAHRVGRPRRRRRSWRLASPPRRSPRSASSRSSGASRTWRSAC